MLSIVFSWTIVKLPSLTSGSSDLEVQPLMSHFSWIGSNVGLQRQKNTTLYYMHHHQMIKSGWTNKDVFFFLLKRHLLNARKYLWKYSNPCPTFLIATVYKPILPRKNSSCTTLRRLCRWQVHIPHSWGLRSQALSPDYSLIYEAVTLRRKSEALSESQNANIRSVAIPDQSSQCVIVSVTTWDSRYKLDSP